MVPAGEFVTGPIVLASNVNLHVSEGATLKFVTDPAKYPRVFSRWEGIECMNYCPLVYAFEQTNMAVTGKGTLDGQAARDNWWAWKLSHWKAKGQDLPEDLQRPDARELIAMGAKGVPVAERVFGAGRKLRPSFIQPYRCKNVLIEGVTILRSPMWEVHPVLCQNVTVRGVTISSHGPNNDGCDPESCRDVLIERCVFDVGDDCIAIKSGRNDDGRRVNVPSENIVMRGCTFKDGHGGVVLGSECSGHIRNVFVEDCTMDSPNLERMLRFKNNAVRGGVLENVFMRNVRVGTVAEAVLTIDLLYEEGANGQSRSRRAERPNRVGYRDRRAARDVRGRVPRRDHRRHSLSELHVHERRGDGGARRAGLGRVSQRGHRAQVQASEPQLAPRSYVRRARPRALVPAQRVAETPA